jgi:myb proto-oncogene protein
MQPTFEAPHDSKKLITRRKFNGDEDERICELVEKLGPLNWDQIAAELGGSRTKRQLRERWQNYLNPELDLGYTEAEDERLIELFQECGPQWAKIATLIGKKSAISTRNRHRSLMALRAKGQRPRYTSALPRQEAVVWDDLVIETDFPEIDMFSFGFQM